MAVSYIPTIGIECHVQLNTVTKLFAAVSNDARVAEPNTLVSHICFGLPGALPVLNAKAVDLAVKAAFTLNTKPQKFSKFDRKHYFYPDLPMGYQITQFDQPIIVGGFIDIVTGRRKKRIGITRAHLEADAGKSTHPIGKDYSLVDLNRAGTPLLEIVSEPDLHSALEAKAYAQELYLRIKYAGISDVDLFQGNMRFDVNVSLSKNDILGTRTETKNLNSFKAVGSAVEYEIKRQSEQLNLGKKIIQETRGWDEAKQKTVSQRGKESAHDYRYFPDPDLPPIVLDQKYVDVIEATLPKLPDYYRRLFKELDLDVSQMDTIIDAPELAEWLDKLMDGHDASLAITVANWLTGEIKRWVSEGLLIWGTVIKAQKNLINLAVLKLDNKLSSTAAKTVLKETLLAGGDPLKIANDKNLVQESDESSLVTMVEQVLSDNPKAAQDIKSGHDKAIGFLVGRVMKASQGKANPGKVQQIIVKLINNT